MAEQATEEPKALSGPIHPVLANIQLALVAYTRPYTSDSTERHTDLSCGAKRVPQVP